MRSFNKIFANKKLKRDLIKYLAIIFVLILLFLVFTKLTAIIILMAASIAVSLFMAVVPLRWLGLEFVTFASILSAVISKSPLIGAVVAFILISFHMFITRSLNIYILWVVPTYCVAAFIAGFFPATNIVALGIFMTLAINIVQFLFSLIISPSQLPKLLPWSITAVLINMFFFRVLALPILSMIT